MSPPVGWAMSREQAAAAVATAAAERDAIQANLLELDDSFGRKLLAGATLTGETKRRWDTASARLTSLWETFSAYSAVVDRAASLAAEVRRSSDPRLSEITALLTGPSVRVARSTPLARRDLTGAGSVDCTIATAVQEMKRAFAAAADVVTAAENVWNEVADRVQRVAGSLAQARRQAGDVTGDDALETALAAAEADLAQVRDVLNSDPLTLWQGGRVDVARAGRLEDRAAAAVAQAAEVAKLRENADAAITAAARAAAAAGQARQDALAVQDRARIKIAGADLTPPPELTALTERLAALTGLKQAGRFPRLAAELRAIEEQAAACAAQCRAAEQQAVTLLDRRDELRGLLDAYRARALRLGAAEDADLGARYEHARELLWTAPCDLPSAAAAVTGYQQAVRTLAGQGEKA